MFTVYWTENNQSARMLQTESLSELLTLTEALRVRQRNGEPLSAITFCSESLDVVGRSGVDVTGSDYDWKKRRT